MQYKKIMAFVEMCNCSNHCEENIGQADYKADFDWPTRVTRLTL